MKVLIVYDTVSPAKMTAKVAQAIGEVLKEKGIEVDSFYVKDVDRATVKNYDCAHYRYFRFVKVFLRNRR